MYSYGWEKLHLAVHALTGSRTRRERLIDAVSFNLIHITPENDLPVEMHAEFKQFMSDITSVPAKGSEGTIAAAANKMTEQEIDSAIEKIIGFYDEVCRHKELC